MRRLPSNLAEAEVRPRLRQLIDALFAAVPAGVGARGFVHLTAAEFRRVMVEGAGWGLTRGYGWPEDLDRIEGGGCLPGANPAAVSERAASRGMDQARTRGSSNHYLAVQDGPP